ncbi:hypothetical protein JCM24511_03197 [Saitozyma sp. JCM 24511]|nr:hypothetical protein JCM24511_03197 [Saitozyma sp. JCM 24511]
MTNIVARPHHEGLHIGESGTRNRLSLTAHLREVGYTLITIEKLEVLLENSVDAAVLLPVASGSFVAEDWE